MASIFLDAPRAALSTRHSNLGFHPGRTLSGPQRVSGPRGAAGARGALDDTRRHAPRDSPCQTVGLPTIAEQAVKRAPRHRGAAGQAIHAGEVPRTPTLSRK